MMREGRAWEVGIGVEMAARSESGNAGEAVGWLASRWEIRDREEVGVFGGRDGELPGYGPDFFRR